MAKIINYLFHLYMYIKNNVRFHHVVSLINYFAHNTICYGLHLIGKKS